MRIRILGPDCPSCTNLEHSVREALECLGMEASIEKVHDYGEVLGYGVIRTPGLAIDDTVLVSGSELAAGEVAALLASAAR